jgi:hypothetical protein
MKHLKTAAEVVDALGGYVELAKALNISPKTTHFWHSNRKKISARYYVTMTDMLENLPEPARAPVHLWFMDPPVPRPRRRSRKTAGGLVDAAE